MIPQVTIPEGTQGPWRIERFTVEPNSFENFRLAMSGRSVRPGTYTALKHANRGIVMSDTAAEMRDHYQFVRRAEGRVLINGLGLGMCLGAVLAKPAVEHVTVVEIDSDVIALVAPHYTCDPRVEIVNASAFDYAPPKTARYGAVWHDIWDEICTENLTEMTRLKRKYGRKADWQGCWSEPEVRRHLRAEKTRRGWWR